MVPVNNLPEVARMSTFAAELAIKEMINDHRTKNKHGSCCACHVVPSLASVDESLLGGYGWLQ